MQDNTNTNNDAPILDKLEKLLRLSQSPVEAEAESAMRMAIRLATKHNIDLSRVTIQDKKQNEIKFGRVDYDVGQRMPVAQTFISPLLIRFFQVRLVYTGNRAYGRRMVFLGTEENINIAVRINEFLNHTFMYLWRTYQKRNGLEVKYRDSYLMGLALGLADKMEAEQKQTIQNFLPEASDQQQYGLVIISQNEQLVKYEANQFTDLKSLKSRNLNSNDANVRAAGYMAGQKINTNAATAERLNH